MIRNLAVLLLLAVSATTTYTQAATLTAGDIDNAVSPFDAADDAQPRPGFETWLIWETNNWQLNNNQALEFDRVGGNQTLGHTFNVPVGDIDLSQPVIFTVKFFGATGSNDVIGLQAFDGPEFGGDSPTFPQMGYSNFISGYFGSYGSGASTISDPISVDLRTLIANLGPLNGQDIASTINTLGYLDVWIGDDTGVDYLQLSYQVIPEPSSLVMLLGGLMLLGGRVRR